MAYFIIIIASLLFIFYLYKLNASKNLVFILPLYYVFTVLYVFIGLYIFKYAQKVPFDIHTLVTDEYIVDSGKIYIFASLSFYFGAVLFSQRETCNTIIRNSDIEFKHQKLLLFLSCIVFFIYVFSYGVEPLIYRVGYISSEHERSKVGAVVFYLTSPFIFVLMPFIKRDVLRILIYISFFLALFSSSSRFLVMLPFLYLVGTYIKNNKIPLLTFIIQSILIVGGLIFVLQIRYYQYHGLIPNTVSFFTKGIDYEYIFVGLNYAFSFSLMGTAFVLERFSLDMKSLLVSINPLPSAFVDIKYMLSTQSMLPTAPISAISLLSLFSYIGIAFFYFITGCLFSYFLSKLRNKTILYYIILGLFIMFTLFSIQYNLRGLTRFLYYSIIIYVCYLFWAWFSHVFRKEG